MRAYVMRQATLTRLKNNDKSILCKFCGEQIREGELYFSRAPRSTHPLNHISCEEAR